MHQFLAHQVDLDGARSRARLSNRDLFHSRVSLTHRAVVWLCFASDVVDRTCSVPYYCFKNISSAFNTLPHPQISTDCPSADSKLVYYRINGTAQKIFSAPLCWNSTLDCECVTFNRLSRSRTTAGVVVIVRKVLFVRERRRLLKLQNCKFSKAPCDSPK